MPPSSKGICLVSVRYSAGGTLSPVGVTSINRRMMPDLASVIFTGLLVPMIRNALNRLE